MSVHKKKGNPLLKRGFFFLRQNFIAICSPATTREFSFVICNIFLYIFQNEGKIAFLKSADFVGFVIFDYEKDNVGDKNMQ